MPFNLAKFKSAQEPETLAAPSWENSPICSKSSYRNSGNCSPALIEHSTRSPRQIFQLIDANEVIRMLGFHLAANQNALRRSQGDISPELYARLFYSYIESGGLLQGTATQYSKDSAIVPSVVGLPPANSSPPKGDGAELNANSVQVRSLWIRSTRLFGSPHNGGGGYWRASIVEGYKSEPFPHFPLSRLAESTLTEYLNRSDRCVIGSEGAEYGDIAHLLLSTPFVRAIEGDKFLLSTSASNLQMVRVGGSAGEQSASSGTNTLKVSLRDNAGRRVMGVREAFEYYAMKLGQKKAGSRTRYFEDFGWQTFSADPGHFVARWQWVNHVGLRAAKARLREVKELHLLHPDYWEAASSLTNPESPLVNPSARGDVLATAQECLESHPLAFAEQLASMGNILAGTGLGHAIKPVQLPVRYGVEKLY